MSEGAKPDAKEVAFDVTDVGADPARLEILYRWRVRGEWSRWGHVEEPPVGATEGEQRIVASDGEIVTHYTFRSYSPDTPSGRP